MTAAFYLKRVGGLVECRAMESAVAQGLSYDEKARPASQLVHLDPSHQRAAVTFDPFSFTTKHGNDLYSQTSLSTTRLPVDISVCYHFSSILLVRFSLSKSALHFCYNQTTARSSFWAIENLQ